MENQATEIIDLINSLIEINNDRIEGFQLVSAKTDDEDLKSLFSEMSTISYKFRSDLANEIKLLYAEASSATTTEGKMFRALIEAKSAVSLNDRKTLLNICETIEEAALKAYENALEKEALRSNFLVSKIDQQRIEVRKSHERVKKLRDVFERQ